MLELMKMTQEDIEIEKETSISFNDKLTQEKIKILENTDTLIENFNAIAKDYNVLMDFHDSMIKIMIIIPFIFVAYASIKVLFNNQINIINHVLICGGLEFLLAIVMGLSEKEKDPLEEKQLNNFLKIKAQFKLLEKNQFFKSFNINLSKKELKIESLITKLKKDVVSNLLGEENFEKVILKNIPHFNFGKLIKKMKKQIENKSTVDKGVVTLKQDKKVSYEL